MAGYCVVFIVHATPCCRIEEPHLEIELLYAALVFLCSEDVPVARVAPFKPSAVCVCVAVCVFQCA